MIRLEVTCDTAGCVERREFVVSALDGDVHVSDGQREGVDVLEFLIETGWFDLPVGWAMATTGDVRCAEHRAS